MVVASQPMEEGQWDIYLSYNEEDKGFADWLYGKLHEKNYKVWYEKYEILIGESILEKRDEGLKASKLLIIVLSNHALTSFAKAALVSKLYQQITTSNITILPIVLYHTDVKQLPEFLKEKKHIQFPLKGSDDKFEELYQHIERHLNHRRPIKKPDRDNPYHLVTPVDPKLFIVNESLVKPVAQDIVRKQSISIFGVSKMGKSSLLNFLRSKERLIAEYYVVTP